MIDSQRHYSALDDTVQYLHNQNEQTRLKSQSIHALPRGWHVGHIDTSCIHSLVPSNAGGTTVPLHCDPLHHELPGSLLDMWTTAALDCALNSKRMCLVHQNAISHADDLKKFKAQDIGSRSKTPWPSAQDVQLFLHVLVMIARVTGLMFCDRCLYCAKTWRRPNVALLYSLRVSSERVMNPGIASVH